MRYYIIAGEASGDLHASKLIHELKMKDAEAEIMAWGGDHMQKAGAILRKHYSETAFMGFTEVLKHLGRIRKLFIFAKKDILEFNPHAVILVDYPGFNLRMAKWLHQKGFKVVYYISPQLWAWNEKRVKKIKSYVDQMMVILPFEKAFYKKHKIDVEFVGHPLLEELHSFKKDPEFTDIHHLESKPCIALLPGSRKQEIVKILPAMLEACTNISDHQVLIAQSPNLDISNYKPILARFPQLKARLIKNRTYQVLAHSKAAVVTSGTATLEAALLNVPQVVCYRATTLSYQLAKRLIRVPYISIVNLIVNQKIIEECIQQDCNGLNIYSALKNLMNEEKRIHILEGYQKVKELLGTPGASKKAAKLILDIANSGKKNGKDFDI